MQNEPIFNNTLDKLTLVFAKSLKENKDIFEATKITIQTILSMSFTEDYKNSLAKACIEASSLIDVQRVKEEGLLIQTFRTNLESELTHLFENNVSSYRP